MNDGFYLFCDVETSGSNSEPTVNRVVNGSLDDVRSITWTMRHDISVLMMSIRYKAHFQFENT